MKRWIERAADFIYSWFYYPKMKRYLKDRYDYTYQESRMFYAWYHCHAGRLK